MREGVSRAVLMLAAWLATGAAFAADIRGVVRDGRSGLPLEGAVVALAESPQQAATDATGAFALAQVPPGDVRLLATRPGYRRAVVELADAASPIDIGLEPLVVPRGRGPHRDGARRGAPRVRPAGGGLVARGGRARPLAAALDARGPRGDDRRLRPEDEPRWRLAVRARPDRQPGPADGRRHPPQQLDLPLRAEPVPRHRRAALDRADRGGARLGLDALRQRRDRRRRERPLARAAVRLERHRRLGAGSCCAA